MTTSRRQVLVTALVALVLVLAGCTPGSPDGSKESTVQPTAPVLSKEDAATALSAYAAALNTQLGGGKLTQYGDPITDPCEKDTAERPSRTFSLAGSYDVDMPAAQQLAALARLHQQWQRNGWTIGTWATAQSGDRHLSGLDPANNYDVALFTNRGKGFVGIAIGTPCYRYPTATTG